MHGQLVPEKEVTMAGWIKLHRSLLEEDWYKDVNMRLLFIHCLLSANYEPTEWKDMTIPRGSFVTSIRQLAEDTGMSVRNVRTCLERHKQRHKLDTNSGTKYTVVTICDYDRYNGQTMQADTIADTKVTQTATLYREDIEKIENISTSTAPACACTREGDGDGIDADIRELRGSQVWLEQIMMKHRILPGELDGLFADFAAECRCNGMQRHTDLNDAKRHFNAWLRIIKEKEDGKTNWRDSERNVRDAQREAILRTMQVVAGTAEVDRDVQKPF